MTSHSDKQTGGPAFPINVDSEMTCLGMTLRDYFAAKAMQAFYSRPDSDEWEPHEVAADAYVIADAMLKARDA